MSSFIEIVKSSNEVDCYGSTSVSLFFLSVATLGPLKKT